MAMGTILIDDLFIKVHFLYSRIKASKNVDNNLGYATTIGMGIVSSASNLTNAFS
jgi:hypothetical protein